MTDGVVPAVSPTDPVLAWVMARLPAGCAAAGGLVGAPAAGPYAEEEARVARAVEGRRREFRAGRARAREALATLGAPMGALLAHARGDPAWPDGFVGSITHSSGRAYAVAARAASTPGIGIDLEADDPLEDDVAARVCRPEELAAEPMLASRGIDAPKLRFVAKEAWYKAIYPRVGRYVDFMEARVIFAADGEAFFVEPLPADLARLAPIHRMSGRFHHGRGLLFALVHDAGPADRG